MALVARPSDRLEAAAVSRARWRSTDLATPDGPGAAVAAAVAALGGLDLLLVNSGGPPPGVRGARRGGLDPRDRWHAAGERPRLIRAALPHLRASDRPAILVILSSTAREPIPG